MVSLMEVKEEGIGYLLMVQFYEAVKTKYAEMLQNMVSEYSEKILEQLHKCLKPDFVLVWHNSHGCMLFTSLKMAIIDAKWEDFLHSLAHPLLSLNPLTQLVYPLATS